MTTSLSACETTGVQKTNLYKVGSWEKKTQKTWEVILKKPILVYDE